MPLLTPQKKREIVRVLGYPYNYVSNFTVLATDIDSDIITEVDDYLSKIDEIDAESRTQLSSSNIKRLDDIEFFNQKETSTIAIYEDARGQYTRRISDLLSIPLSYGHRHKVTYQ
jgi:hypothetical protein